MPNNMPNNAQFATQCTICHTMLLQTQLSLHSGFFTCPGTVWFYVPCKHPCCSSRLHHEIGCTYRVVVNEIWQACFLKVSYFGRYLICFTFRTPFWVILVSCVLRPDFGVFQLSFIVKALMPYQSAFRKCCRSTYATLTFPISLLYHSFIIPISYNIASKKGSD